MDRKAEHPVERELQKLRMEAYGWDFDGEPRRLEEEEDGFGDGYWPFGAPRRETLREAAE